MAKTNYTREILHFFGDKMSKKFCNYLDGLHTRKKRFRLVSDFFRAQLYLTKVSSRVAKTWLIRSGMVDGHNKVALVFR